ncbi:MAG TPA: tetratricopeptide repeat protein [Gallionellaceae bacterium]|nr:tetratricopeptide repeat protein [Gallionellaceae bacterium]
MIRFNRFNRRAALCALLLCFSLNSGADEIQDANKLFKQGQLAQALSKVEAVLSNKPKDAQARFLKALILTEQGQTDESVRIFSGLTEDYPELPEPYNNLAVLYAAQGQYEKAKVALEKALRTHPSYSTAHDNLGDIYAKMASQAYDRALQLDRSKTSSTTRLALIKDMYTPPSAKTSGTKLASASNSPAATTPATATVAATAPVAAATASAPAAVSAPVITTAVPVPPKASAARPVVAEAAHTSSNDEVLKALNDWAKAWSSRNVKKYLSMYAKDFKTPNNESRSSWEQQRHDRISKPQPIVVSVSNARIKFLDDNHASVSFVQSYRSGALKSTTLKTLEMTKSDGLWQIRSEQAGAKR